MMYGTPVTFERHSGRLSCYPLLSAMQGNSILQMRKVSMERLEHLALWVNNPEGGK